MWSCCILPQSRAALRPSRRRSRTLVVTKPRPPSCSLFPYTTLFRSDPQGLKQEVKRSNKFAEAGVDEDFHKGELRSEEHTSELQSRGHLVCRLLLEKKN